VQDNLSISGTHTHSGPGGFLQYILYLVTSLGFVKETFDAWVQGITASVVMAHKSMQPAKILINQGTLQDANINRSPTSYLRNPQAERDQYPDGDTDKNMLLLNFVSEATGKSIGVFNWFAVHATSMNNTNTLVSGDNKGYAAYALEKDVNGASSTPGVGPFVAAFASTNLGDVSPNTMGAKCIDTGLPCDGTTSTCNGRCENCIAFGPGTNGDIFESTQIIGDRQYRFAKNLMQTAKEEITGPVDFRHSFVDMPSLNVSLSNGQSAKLCTPAMG
jgi:neutral ceramidase